MSDSIPSLRRKLAEANARIKELESRGPVERLVEKRVEVAVPVERLVEKRVEVAVPVEKVVYITDPSLENMVRKLQEKLAKCTSQ